MCASSLVYNVQCLQANRLYSLCRCAFLYVYMYIYMNNPNYLRIYDVVFFAASSIVGYLPGNQYDQQIRNCD